MALSQMSPRRPYILRAFYDWLLDNKLTPHLVVDVTLPGVQVPMEFARDGQIVLNITPRAVSHLELGNDEVHFSARFSGTSRQVYIPLYAIIAIYARENGAGTMFDPEPGYDAIAQETVTEEPAGSPVVLVDTKFSAEENSGELDGKSPKSSRGRPALRVVK